ncbi:isocitrate/isopropylmalate dehydrogenase family protein [Vulcanisaeta distributa]|uniref:Isopropylmalate/isohomocitrate dehydrogenase n=1 Tax=Vulcanisaeta distributa (strain DSM 14429 / JCM 11212 / NBRC 100878 / IC-017) TaxID=572478 RepID=E1QNA8_VULDI|nr:isocitrate/isopropylmalate dehydrogenase family protein [Vulcanisaeta distributa]ADN50078.1 isopropylmalate/isohomocitrate dehydrogenase [Vulcanisaeta distributa DSM 14429]
MRIAVIEGDGIGPEVTRSAIEVLKMAASKYGLNIDIAYVEAGDNAIRKYGEALPSRYWPMIENAEAILKGPVGESAGDVVVKLRRGLDLYANIRPARNYPGIKAVRDGVDLVIVRENTEDVYVRAEYMLSNDTAVALRVITRRASERIARVALNMARTRRRRVTIVHKANVLTVSDGLFRSVVREVAREYPEVAINEMYIDAAVMDLVRRPQDFDIIVTTNLYGDILSDLAAYVTGSIGLAPSANVGDNKALFEPIHGAAFDIAGKGIANPTAMILSTAWMLRWYGEKTGNNNYVMAGNAIENAVINALSQGIHTPDLGGNYTTESFTAEVIKRI